MLDESLSSQFIRHTVAAAGASSSRLGTPSRPSPLDRLKDSTREQLAMPAIDTDGGDTGCTGTGAADIEDWTAADSCNGVSFNAAASASRLTLQQHLQQQQQQQQQLNLNASLNDSLSQSFAFCNFLNRGCDSPAAIKGPQQPQQQQQQTQLCDQARSPTKAICTIDRRTTRILTANTVFGRLFDSASEALIGQRLLALIGRPGGGESAVARVPETALDEAGEAVQLSGKLLEVRRSGLPVSVWAKSVSPGSESSALVILEPVHRVTLRLTADPDGRIAGPPEGQPAALRLLPRDLAGRSLYHLLPGCRPPPRGETTAAFAATTVDSQPCAARVDRLPPDGRLSATLTFYCNVSGLLTLREAPNASEVSPGQLVVHSCHPLLAKLLLGRSAKRLSGLPVDDLLPGFAQRHQLQPHQVNGGSFRGEARHSSGALVPVAYQLRRVDLRTSGGGGLWCVWLSRDTEDWPAGSGEAADDEAAEDEVSGEDEQPADEAPQGAAAAKEAAAETKEDEPKDGELSSRYEVTLHLGRGAYGYVKAARRRSDGVQVVVKFVRKAKLAAHQLVERPGGGGGFIPREAAILQSLSHPHIVPLLEAFESRRYYELVMPRHGLGMDLFEFIDRNPNLDEPLASHMFRQMSSAVAYLHCHGIAHRDLKDENVILDEQFSLMLIDFGAAAFVSPDRPFSVFCGTTEYCAPEILRGNAYHGPEADIWSLGVTLYTLVFGENPFFDAEETLAGVLKPRWTPSPQLGRLLRVMLQVDPGLRATIGEVERHPWTTQPVDPAAYSFDSVLPNCQFDGNIGSDYRLNTEEAAE